MNITKLLDFGAEELNKNDIKSFRLDSEILLSKILGKSREEILITPESKIKFKVEKKFKNLIKRRTLKEPIAYITQEKEFWSKSFEVSEHTLIPRPETELMVEKLIEIYNEKKIFILDIGTGSGCIIISLLSELNNSRGIGLDISKEALIVAKKNAEKNNIFKKIKFLHGSFLELNNRKFDLIVSNPPYIETKALRNLEEDIKKYEPLIALDGGNDGLDVIKKVIYKSKEILKIKGLLALEIGNGQYNKVSKILKKNNYNIVHRVKDYKENVRCVISRLN